MKKYSFRLWRLAGATAAIALALGTAATTPALASQASPAPAANGLNAISCPSATSCWAVGEHNHENGWPTPAIERLSHGTWSAVAAPEPRRAIGGSLEAVWCGRGPDCLAAGYYATSSPTEFPLVERWNGVRWSRVSAPDAGSTSVGLYGLACTSARDCWAVGTDDRATVAEHWNGTAWSVVPSPNVGSGGDYPGAAVACPAAGDCWAVWTWHSASGTRYGTLTAHWNGSAWSRVTTPTAGNSQSMLNDIYCSSGTACLAVGGGPKAAVLAERWNGSAWSVVTDRGLPRRSGLAGVWCSRAAACLAVGGRYIGREGGANLAARWNGTAWSTQATPNLADWPINGLSDLACTSTSNCWAVGSTLNPGAPGVTQRIIEHWNGRKWSLAS
jgi:hypothetical protein